MTETYVSWLSTEGVLKNGGIRPPGTEGKDTSRGTNKPTRKVEKDKSFTSEKPVAPARASKAKPITHDRVVSEGLYKFGETIARVKISQTSHKPYALVKNRDNGSWEYTPGAFSKLKASDRIEDSTPKPAASQITEGFYAYGAGVAEVVKSKAGRLYAKVLDVLTGQWSYAQGVVFQLKPEDRLTLSQAAALGKKWERCMCCGKELTNPESIARGIGPICAGKL